MPKLNHEIFFIPVLTSINKIKKTLLYISYEQFLQNDILFDSTLRRLQVIGESVKNLLTVNLLKENQYWKKIVLLANLETNEPFDPDPEIIFRVASDHVQEIEKNVLHFINKIPDKKYLRYAFSDTKEVLSKMKHYDEVAYLDEIEKNLA